MAGIIYILENLAAAEARQAANDAEKPAQWKDGAEGGAELVPTLTLQIHAVRR